MKQRSFSLTVTILFAVVGVMHALRLIFQWDVVIGGTALPMWFSVVAVIAAAYLVYSGYTLVKNCEK
jgi:hypothetical protein